jgi:hypothetical protein
MGDSPAERGLRLARPNEVFSNFRALARAAGAQNALGDRPAVDFGGAVVDAERADLAEELRAAPD